MPNSLQQTWNGLSLGQRVALGAVLAAVFGAILLVARVAGRPSYAVLFSNLETEDAAEVTTKLRELKVSYQLSGGGRVIEVPDEKVYDLRLSLATEGLPRGGSVGFELFDRTSFGATDFTQHLNYQRALQGELTRTINRLEGVVESRIHLAIPEKPLFSEKEEPATASVVLHLQPGYQLDDRGVAGIVHLVSSAVEGLRPANVTVHDAQGELLSSAGPSSAMSGSQIQLQEQYERRVESELRRLAEQVLGPGKSAIQVSADLNWDQTETTSETYGPGGRNGRNLPVEEQNTTETYGDRARRPGLGSPGVASNLNAPPAAAAAAAVAGDPARYLNSQSNNRYAVNKTLERRVEAPVKIRRLSIAVLLDSSVTTAQQQALQDAFAAAAGLDLMPPSRGGRGDRISVRTVAFDKSVATDATRAADAAAKTDFRIALIRNGAAVLVVVLVAVVSLILMRRLQKPRPEPLDTIITDVLPDPTTYRAIATVPAAIPEPGAVPALTDRIRQLAAERPDEVARQLQAWMAE